MNPLLIAQLGSAAIGGISGILSGNSANKANLQAVRETNKANAELAKYNWQQQVDMWNAQNAYNTPSAQMQRYSAAGLNPHLIYGQGSNGNSSSIPTPQLPTMQAGRVEPLPFGEAANGVTSALHAVYDQKLNRDRLESENSLRRSQIASQSMENVKRSGEVLKIMADAGLSRQKMQQSSELFKHTLKAAELANSQAALDIQNTRNDLSLFPLRKTQAALQIDLMNSNLGLNSMQAKKISQDILESAERIVKLAAESRQVRLLNYKLGLGNRFEELTQQDQVSMVSQKLLDITLRNQWHAEYGFAGGEVSSTSSAIHYQVKNVISSILNSFKN